MRALFPRLLDYEHASRSVVLGALRSALTTASPQAIALDRLSTFDDRALLEVWNRGAFLTLRDGVDTLAKRLEEDLQNDECAEVLTGTRCIEITRDANDDTLRCTLEDAETGRPAGVIQADHVVSAVPAFQLARMLDVGQSPGSTDGHGHRALLASDLVANLTAIPFVSIAPVNLAWDTLFPLPVRPTIGYLAPSVETVPELGVVFDAPFPFDQRQPYPSTVLTVILGGPSFAKATGRALDETSPERLLTIARDVVARRLGIAAAPSAHHVALHRQSMPQYNVGHVARVGRIQQAVDSIYDGRLHLAGASYRGIGVPDCIQSGYNVAQAVATDMLAEEH